jgi:hypothetical protein
MSVTTEDIAEAVTQLWADAAALSDPTTGLVKSMVMGRVPDQAVSPYASFKVTDGAVNRNATFAYMQAFTVEFKTWDESGAANAGAIKAAIETAFVLGHTVLSLGSGRTLNILHSIKAPGALEEDEATRQSQAVKISTDRFEFLCQG